MPALDQLFDQLWNDFTRLNPQAGTIHGLLERRGDTVVNDHIAFRTFDDPRVNIDMLARPFVSAGYSAAGEYHFATKRLDARHFEHAEPDRPKVFISQLRLADFSDDLRQIVAGLLDQIPAETLRSETFCTVGRPWQVAFSDYERLGQESEYAAWLSAFGFCANHFTVLVNALESIDSLEELNALLKDNDFPLNSSGGEIKGTPAELLEQSSTLAPELEVEFLDGPHRIPSCYYEFARRYPKPDGTLYSGFIAASADKIFESTDRR